MDEVCVSVNGIQYAISYNDFNRTILPLLQIHNKANHSLKSCVESVLAACSKTFLTENNTKVFTKFCLEANITEHIINNQNNIDNFKKELSQCVSNRSEFNVIDLINRCYNVNIDKNSQCGDLWYADTHNRRGHDRVGEGEIFLSFFSRGTKEKAGDIGFERVIPLKVEIKGANGRLLKSREIILTQEFYDVYARQPHTIHTMCVTLCVISGAIDCTQAVIHLNDQTLPAIYSDVYNAIIATNALNEFDILEQRIKAAWGRNTRKTALRAICGAIQLSLYKKEKSFDWIILTKKETPYLCKGFLVSDNVLANTLTIINNDITIQQNLDGKGYHISF